MKKMTQKKKKKNLQKRVKQLKRTLDWLDIEDISNNQCVINDGGKKYYVRGIRIHPLNIHMLDVNDNFNVIESLANAFNRMNFKIYWKFIYKEPDLDEQNHNIMNMLRNEDDKAIINLGNMFLNYHEWFRNQFKEISFYFIVMENEKMIDKVYSDLKRYMSATRLNISEMTTLDFRSVIAYDFDNPTIDEYYFSVLKQFKQFDMDEKKLILEE